MNVLYCLVYLAVIAVLSNPLGLLLPRRFDACRFPFRLYAFEKNGDVYLKLGIRKWKDRVPDMSRINKRMAPKSVDKRPNSDAAMLLLQEGCRAEIVHWVLMPLSLPCILIGGSSGAVISLLFSFGNLPFILIQRYNRPRQLALYTALKIKESEKGTDKR